MKNLFHHIYSFVLKRTYRSLKVFWTSHVSLIGLKSIALLLASILTLNAFSASIPKKLKLIAERFTDGEARTVSKESCQKLSLLTIFYTGKKDLVTMRLG